MLLYFFVLLILIYLVFLNQMTIAIYNKNLHYGVGFKSNVFLLAIFALFFLIATYRNINIGTDTEMYFGFYLHEGYEKILEPGFRYIYYLARYMGDFKYWLAITSGLVLIFIYIGIKRNTSNYLIATFFYFSTFTYFFVFNGIRQAIAASILFAFLDILVDKGLKKILVFFSLILVMMLFHNSAIFLLFLIFVPTKKIFSIRYVYLTFIMTIFMYFNVSFKNFMVNILMKYSYVYSAKYSNNLEVFFQVNKEKGLIEFLPVAFQMCFLIFLIKYFKGENSGDKLTYFVTNLYVIYIALYAFSGIEAIDRFQFYLAYFNIYFFTIYSIELLKSKKNGSLYFLLIAIFFILYFILRIFRNTQGVLG